MCPATLNKRPLVAGNNSQFRKRFRSAEAQRGGNAIAELSQLRATRPPTEYKTLLSSFRAAAPKAFRVLCIPGPRSTSDLVWAQGIFQPLSLENELLWANQWLSLNVAKINNFRRYAVEIQSRVMIGDAEGAMKLLDDYVRSAGWSLWAVELRAALLQLSAGTSAQREWLSELQDRAVNRIPGLLFAVFSDRNDDTYSYDAFYSKCMNSFPRFESLAPWVLDYLMFRAVASVDNPEEALPHILCRDLTSSLIDYYEDIVEVLIYIVEDSSLSEYRPSAAVLVSSLINYGYLDHRLNKLSLAFESVLTLQSKPRMQPEAAYCAMYLGSFEPEKANLPKGAAADLIQCQNEGAAAYELFGKLLKWGINLRGVDIGPAVANAALQTISNISNKKILPANTFLLSETVCIDDAAALPMEKASEMLVAYLNDQGKKITSEELLKPSLWNIDEILTNGGPLYLWMATKLLDARDFSELEELIRFLRGKTPYWERQCAKLNILANVIRGRFEEALAELESWYRDNYLYAIEFPADALFAERKWADFRNFDSVIVGLVAHHEYTTRGNSNVGYICKMACREFLQSGLRERIPEDFASASDKRKAQIIAFLRDVWIEENLALCHQFESTAEVRDERMSVLQLLLGWEDARAQEYSEAIKDLTFDQTVQRGLQRIDQTRVFVNESAITRWAEKELEQDYERWKKISESGSGGRAIDDMLRKYALDQANLEVLTEFANGKPTAADALLIDLIDRLYKRFMLDPTDGLDTYLSLRIRHGSFRGTILGPLEEQGLLYSNSGFSEEAFESRWNHVLRLPPGDKTQLIAMMQEFSRDIRRTVDEFVEQRVQVQKTEKPEGAFKQVIPPIFAKLISASLAERPPTFHAFLCNGYFSFWKLIEYGLDGLRENVKEVLATALHSRVERLIQELRALGSRYLPLVTTLTTASTMIKSQCDTVAEWFQLPSMVGGEKYQLPDAIEIASVATKNVHRTFQAKVEILCLPATPLPLTTSALAVLMDCLFVVFENSWKHSGLAEDLPPIGLLAEFDPNGSLLTLICRSALSPNRKQVLLNGELTVLRSKYLGELPLELISREKGSGFPKLARLTRPVPPAICPQPFDFGIEGDQWYTMLTFPLYEREGAFEAYE